MCSERNAEAAGELLDALDVVRVRVGAKDVGDHNPVALDAVEERLGDAVRVDQDTLAALALGDEVGVREPVRVLGALEDQNSITLLIPFWASMSSKPRFTSSSLTL